MVIVLDIETQEKLAYHQDLKLSSGFFVASVQKGNGTSAVPFFPGASRMI